ncbi:MAG: EexN family lipoprotein [Caulobacter sp.]|nr:EexN family lipoprotein [Caulobacter sp.]
MRRRLVALIVLTGCTPAPTSVDTFRADPGRAERMVDACDAGRTAGPICDNARAGLTAARRDARMTLYREGF